MSDRHLGYVSVAEIAAAYRISTSNVYRLASEHRWRKYRLNRLVRYRWEDVDDTMQNRARLLANNAKDR